MRDLESTVTDTLRLLRTAASERLRPADVLARLGAAERADGVEPDVQIVWEREPLDGTFHYDALLDVADGTVSVSFCPDGDRPWPLRGVRRWSEGELVRVDETSLYVRDGLAIVDFIWDQEPLVSTLVNSCLLHNAIDAAGIEPSDEEVQASFDRFRLKRGLLTVDDTHRWLARHGFTLERLENHMKDEARIDRLFEQVAGDRIEELLHHRLSDLDLVLVAYFDLVSEQDAKTIVDDILCGKADFFALAAERAAILRAHSGVGELPLTKSLLRYEVGAAHREPLFTAAVGDTVGPIPLEHGFRVFRILATSPATPENNARERARRMLFEEWLEGLRAKARIEWQWGRERSHPAEQGGNGV